jgi:glycosyltransferase involved in cell wall biosynthesis
MKLLVVLKFNPWIQNSAIASRWLSLLEGLVKQGTSITVYIYGGYSSKREFLNWGYEGEHYLIKYKYLNESVNTGYIKARFVNYLGFLFYNPIYRRKLFRELDSSYSVIWLDNTLFSAKFAVKLKSFGLNIKIFCELSEFLDIHKYNKGNFIQRLYSERFYHYFNNVAFHVYDGFALMTLTLLDYYKSMTYPHPRFLHLPMTVDLERFDQLKQPLKEFQAPYIAFVGVMNDAKDGVNILIKAFNIINAKHPNHNVYLVGGWNYDTPRHQELIKEYGLEAKVFWMNEYPRDQIPNIICNADLLVLPRPDSKQAQGGFPTKLGEYLATGNPVCATRVGEIPDYLIDNESVFFAVPGSIESFAEAMDRALSIPDNAKRVGLNGRRVAEREFNKDIQARKLLDFLKELNADNSV